MAETLQEAVKRRLKEHQSPQRIREELLDAGHTQSELNVAFRKLMVEQFGESSRADTRNARIFATHEVINRVGYGAAPPPFINILFAQTGAGLFLLGLFNGLRTMLSMLITSVMQEYARRHRVSRGVISAAGILFGFSFLVMALALWLSSVALFALGILLAGIGVVTYGDLYNKFVLETLRREKRGGLLLALSKYGLIITMAAMLLSGWLIERFPAGGGDALTLFGYTFQPVGYLLSFEITALAFIIGGYLLMHINETRIMRQEALTRFIKGHLANLLGRSRELLKNPYVALLLVATLITGFLDVLGHAYYGLFIYRAFAEHWFGGFLNIAIIYAIAIVASYLGPLLTTRVHKLFGLTPLLVFGTMLMAILPFTLVYNPNIPATTAALACAVIGSAIMGVGQGLLARKLMKEETRRAYFMSLGLLFFVPYLILFPLGSWFTALFGMETLFLVIGVSLLLVVTPLYFLLVLVSKHQRL